MDKITKKFNLIQVLLLFFAVFPILTYAVTAPVDFKGAIMIIVNIITAILPIIVLLAVFYFLWGLTSYLKNTGENKDEATQMMTNGIIGFFVMSSVWGLVAILSATFGTPVNIPSNSSLQDNGMVSDLLRNQQDSLSDSIRGQQDSLEDSLRDSSSDLKDDSYDSAVSDLLRNQQDSLRESFEEDQEQFDRGLEDLSTDWETGMEQESLENPWEYSEEGTSLNKPEPSAPSWFSKLMPWNWF